MQRIIWIGGVACLAQVACIEQNTPQGDADAALPDAAPDPEPAPPPAPEPREPRPIEPEPEAGEPEPGPPWVCPPEGNFQFFLGACVSQAGMVPEAGRFEATITELGTGWPEEGLCTADGFDATIGRVGSDRARWFNAVTPDGQVWQIVLDMPVEIRFEVGEEVVVDAQIERGFFDGVFGRLSISTEAGLQAFVLAGDRGTPGLDDPELRLARGGESCHVAEQDDFCTFTGHRLSASDPRVDEVHELGYGQVRDVGPFQVINGGILSIGDLGACNAAPENFRVGAWRRK